MTQLLKVSNQQGRRLGIMNRSNLRDNQRKPKGNHSPCAERRFLSPHPGPLPPGEGEACPDRSSIQTRRLFTARSSQFPLPEGEGQGEYMKARLRRLGIMAAKHKPNGVAHERVYRIR